MYRYSLVGAEHAKLVDYWILTLGFPLSTAPRPLQVRLSPLPLRERPEAPKRHSKMNSAGQLFLQRHVDATRTFDDLVGLFRAYGAVLGCMRTATALGD